MVLGGDPVGDWRLVGVAVPGLVALLAACGPNEQLHGDPPPAFHDEPGVETTEPDPPVRLTPEQWERYYIAYVEWRDCIGEEGFILTEGPSPEEFVARGESWWAGEELNEQWSDLQAANPRYAGLSRDDAQYQLNDHCGEAPFAYQFEVGRDAIGRLYDWQVEVVTCLETEGFPLDGPVPSREEFVRTGGSTWVPVREFTARYGSPQGATWVRLMSRCGSPTHDLWLQATDFQIDRKELKATYEEHLALTACLEGAGLTAPAAPPLEEFIDKLGWNWSHAGIWEAVYRDNNRKAVEAFANRIDQTCSGPSG